MNMQIFLDCTGMAVTACFIYFPFEKKGRACWAKALCFIIAGVGFLVGVVGLTVHLSWLVPGSEYSRQLFFGGLGMGRGLVLGLGFSLILSGQWRGTKQDAKQPPALDSN